jgi:hypothetical protein
MSSKDYMVEPELKEDMDKVKIMQNKKKLIVMFKLLSVFVSRFYSNPL